MTKLRYLEIIRVEDPLKGFFFFEEHKKYTGYDKGSLWPKVLTNDTKEMEYLSHPLGRTETE